MPVLLQVDPRTLGQNLWLIITVVVLLAVLGVIGIGGWMGLRMWLQIKSENESWARYQAQRRGPDGQPYPPFIEGTCQACHRGDHKIYHLTTGQALCPECYDAHCRRQSGVAGADDAE